MKPCCGPQRETVTAETISSHEKPAHTKQPPNQERLIHLSGGHFLMGTESTISHPEDGEGPIREVTVSPFFIDPYTVTNHDFQKFVDDTGYITDAEQYGWSFVFHLLVSNTVKENVQQVVQQTPWWYVVEGAYWKAPEGPASVIKHRMDHPVVHVSWNDAQAYCKWVGMRLPTEAEWEYAARGGLEQKIFPWGDDLKDRNQQDQCNIWQGKFPVYNTKEDGFLSTAPVDTYDANGYGLYNTVGNVWEWCADWFSPHHDRSRVQTNPQGPVNGIAKVMKGGSYLCHDSYCNRYRVAARTGNTPDSSSGNVGFRCVQDV